MVSPSAANLPHAASSARLHAAPGSRVAQIGTSGAVLPTPAASPTAAPAALSVPATAATDPAAAPRAAQPVLVTRTGPEPVAVVAPPVVPAPVISPTEPLTEPIPEVIVVTRRVASAPGYFLPFLFAVLAGLVILAAILVIRRRRRRLELEEIERGKLDFLLLSSHELRTPLSVVSGYVAMAEEGTLGAVPPALEDALPEMSGKLSEVESMLDRMLLAVQAAFGRLPVQKQPVAATHLVEAALRHVTRAGLPRSRFQVEGEADLLVEVDPEQTVAALASLLENAAKFSDRAAAVQCRIRRGRLGRRVNVEVIDQGGGLSEAARKVLFRRFGRRPTDIDSHLPGAGLGLHVARELARAQGGDLRLRSTSARGSVFVLSLPAAG